MARVPKQGLRVGYLHHPPDVHHRHPVADVLHHVELVGDEQVGELEPVLQVLQQVEDLRLDRHVERRHRLVAHHELRVERQRAGDADALPLAAGERVRIAAQVLAPQADHLQRGRHPVAALLPPDAGDGQPLADDVEQRHARVEGVKRVLQDHLRVAPEHLELGAVEAKHVDPPQVLVVEPDLAAGQVVAAQQAAPGGGLAAAAFPNQSEGLPLADREVDAVDRLHLPRATPEQTAPNRKVLAQAVHLQQQAVRRGRGAHRAAPGAAASAAACR